MFDAPKNFKGKLPKETGEVLVSFSQHDLGTALGSTKDMRRAAFANQVKLGWQVNELH